ncbi:MAG: hypothetical protein ACRD1B_05150, partial [Thermoanaerobaculia bacterium]
WIEQLYNEGITRGCGGGLYCPKSLLTRAQLAVFLLKAEHASSYVPPPCTGIFADVNCTPTPEFPVNWIEQLYREGVAEGCDTNPLTYCPSAPVAQGQMPVFLGKMFNFQKRKPAPD